MYFVQSWFFSLHTISIYAIRIIILEISSVTNYHLMIRNHHLHKINNLTEFKLKQRPSHITELKRHSFLLLLVLMKRCVSQLLGLFFIAVQFKIRKLLLKNGEDFPSCIFQKSVTPLDKNFCHCSFPLAYHASVQYTNGFLYQNP